MWTHLAAGRRAEEGALVVSQESSRLRRRRGCDEPSGNTERSSQKAVHQGGHAGQHTADLRLGQSQVQCHNAFWCCPTTGTLTVATTTPAPGVHPPAARGGAARPQTRRGGSPWQRCTDVAKPLRLLHLRLRARLCAVMGRAQMLQERAVSVR